MIKDLWYKNAIIYSLNVETFLDSNGDGTGDFEGLSRSLDYLQGLGVTCVWLAPFQKSPRRDDGYDISDYYQVDPIFGTLGDFVDFTHEAQQRGIRVMMDMVVNHTSDQHPWFQEARRDPASKYRDYYVWSDTKPRDAEDGIIFPGVQETTWTYDEQAGQFYFHRFHDFQPDLNTQNPRVLAEIRKIMGFYLELGVSGFRMDAMPFVIETKGPQPRHTQRYALLRDFREFLQWRSRDAIILAEANVEPKHNMRYFGDDGDRLQMMFNFWVNQHAFLSLATGDAGPLAQALDQSRDRPPNAQWGQFLRNHDELDLGRLRDSERQAVFDAMAPDECMQLYGRGIRRRLAPMLQGDPRRLELAYSLMFALPGTPVIRYGDELGMGDNLDLPGRECARTPMQWSPEANAGFTRAAKPVVPVLDHGPYSFSKINVADQRRDPGSLLNWTARMIRMRKEVPEIGWGEFQRVETGHPGVLALQYEWRGNIVLVVHNLTGTAAEVQVRIKGEQGRHLINLLTQDHSHANGRGHHRLIMEPYGYHWYRAGGLGHLLDRTPA
ncbi:alpha-amylase family protein [Ramlibacter rhizophilus]|uniref:Trehalose synthase n=1 Tax=Ramlibacter rhizophilus TaxID=1781167 RepID=A0A4Z0C1I5_9BURK|nr:alpha-amylase family protein [Ramlibacter rhizophilus]TFZ04792.1 trehalose synthase [Ramlibacter rhizophilus]